MQKAIELAKIIGNDIKTDCTAHLKEYNLTDVFGGIYSLSDIDAERKNKIICFIIYAYSAESNWLDLKKDRTDNKIDILKGLQADYKEQIFDDLINNRNEILGISIFNFLEQMKSWKWRAIFDLLDYSSKMFRFATQETDSEKTYEKMNKEGETVALTSDVGIEVITKVHKEKGILLEQAINKRKQADILLEEIAKEFVQTDNATQAEFSFKFTDSSKKSDILSWREYVKRLNESKKATA